MDEIKLFELQCPRCGGQLKESGSVYKCDCCGKAFEKQVRVDVADQLRAVLNEQKQEAIANLRRQLWNEMQAQYINSARIVELARDIKKYLPEDYFANFCETANSANDRVVNAFLNNTSKEDMDDYADIVLDFMLKSAKSANLTAISLFIERAFKGDPVNYDKYITKYEQEAQKVNKGVYDLIITRDVFLAYSSADIDKVIELCDYLESQKITCFLALRNLRHGRGAVDNYDKALQKAIDNCKTVVFVSSTNSRSMDCDALTKELTYIKQKDINNAPVELKNAYDRLPAEYMMPRVEYLIENYEGGDNAAEGVTKVFFHSLEWCKNKQDVASRVIKYITEVRETSAQRAERENRELQQRLEEERRRSEEERRKAKELELKIAEAERARIEAEKARLEAERVQEESRARLEAERRAVEQVGTRVKGNEEKEDSNAKYCKSCRTANRPTAKFCSNCGGREFFANFNEYLESKYKYCTECGAQNNYDDKFCAECGSKKFVPTKKAYEKLVAKKAEEERLRKLRENFNISDGVLTKYTGKGGEVIIHEDIGVTAIGNSAFDGCKLLTAINIPNSVTTISESAFYGCTSLTDVTFGNGVKKIGISAFRGCTSLTDITIPEGVTSLGGYAFSDCTALKSVIIGNGITSIGSRTFSNCVSLEKVVLPESVTSLSADAFAGCNQIKELIIKNKELDEALKEQERQRKLREEEERKRREEEERQRKIREDEERKRKEEEERERKLREEEEESKRREEEERQRKIREDFDIQNNVLVKYMGKGGDVVIPDNVTSIGCEAFAKCDTLISIIIPNNVTAIGRAAFRKCTSLTSVTLPKKLAVVDMDTFWGCTSLKNITIPDSVEYIHGGAFYGCSSLSSINIPWRVTIIGCAAFTDCSSLTSITLPQFMLQMDSNVFVRCKNLKVIYCRAKKPLFGLPKGWDKNWNSGCNADVVWGYKG